jgi:hypothetical protein
MPDFQFSSIKRLEVKHSLFELAFSVQERQDGSGGKDFKIRLKIKSFSSTRNGNVPGIYYIKRV